MVKTKPEIERDLQCFHCGLPCPEPPYLTEGHPFCCTGCIAVYEILRENSLDQYYSISSHPGKASREGKYEFLDEEEIKGRILDFRADGVARVSLSIPAIHCASCLYLLENLYRIHRGLRNIQVNFLKRRVQITYLETETSLSRLVERLSSLGYEPRLNLDLLSGSEDLSSQKEDQADLIRLGVAAFCFGNVMLLSFPEYLAGSEVPPHFRMFFGYLSLVLSLPVLFYSGWGWLKRAFLSMAHRFLSLDVPISLGLLTLFTRSAYEVITQTGPGYFDSLCAYVFFLLLGRFFQQKTFDHLSFNRDYTSYFPLAIQREEGEKIKVVPVERLATGDVIVVRNQELIPADSTLLDGQATLDCSFITGEADPVVRKAGETLLAGGKILGPSARMTVQKKISQSFLVGLFCSQPSHREPSRTLTDSFSPYFTLSVLIISLLSALYWLLLTGDTGRALYVFSSVLIVACPCALALSAPFTHGALLRLLGKKGIFCKSGEVLEGLSSLDTLVFDKTGTLTLSGVKLLPLWEDLSSSQKTCLATLARQSAHPVSRALVEYLEAPAPLTCQSFDEYPGLGIQGTVEGLSLRIGRMDWVLEGLREEPFSLNKENSRGQLALSMEGKLAGLYQLHNHFRPQWRQVIGHLTPTFETHLLSGDLDLERPAMEEAFGSSEKVHFGLTPPEKASYIQKLQGLGRRVAMIGDGLNDAGALMQSHIGIVVMEENSHFSPSCDCILEGKNFFRLPEIFRLARASLSIIRASIGLSIAYNLIGLSFAITATLSPLVAAILMPLSSVSVMVFTTLMALWVDGRGNE